MIVRAVHREDPDPAVMAEAATVLRRGGVLLYPTDTCYGLGCDARNTQAMAKIGAMKGRDGAKKFSVIIPSVHSADTIVMVSEEQRKILEKHLPGPFTFILINVDFRVAATSTLGIRVPDCPVTQKIASLFGEPYITTSANLSGTGALYSFQEIKHNLLDHLPNDLQPNLILDAGELPRTDASTVVDLTGSVPHIVRQGSGTFTA